MPSASPAGTQPAMISLAKSCPVRSQVNGSRRPYAAPGARTAVPIAVNSSPPRENDPRRSRTPTTPCPPSWAHSAVIRPIAVCRAWYMACTSGPTAAGQLDALADPGRSTPTSAEHLTDRLEAHTADGGELAGRSARTPTCRWTRRTPTIRAGLQTGRRPLRHIASLESCSRVPRRRRAAHVGTPM